MADLDIILVQHLTPVLTTFHIFNFSKIHFSALNPTLPLLCPWLFCNACSSLCIATTMFTSSLPQRLQLQKHWAQMFHCCVALWFWVHALHWWCKLGYSYCWYFIHFSPISVFTFPSQAHPQGDDVGIRLEKKDSLNPRNRQIFETATWLF